jgi:hypothetical protein
MNRFERHKQVVAVALAGAALVAAGPAGAETTDILDLSASAGFSTNPGINGNNGGSGFGRISAYGDHSWVTERSSTSVHGFLENTFYLKGGYGSQRIFNVGADTNYTVSPTLSLYGNLYFFGDINGQLSNRLISVPGAPPPVSGPGLPPPTILPNFVGFGHTYQLNGQIGASIRSSELSTISLSAGAQHGWYTGNSALDYTTYFGSVGYSRQISERTSIGPSVYVTYQDYTQGNWANIINPSLTAHTQLSETVTADGAVGVLVVNQHRLGQSNTSVSPSFRLGVCAQGQLSSLCAHVARDAHSSFSNPTTIGSRASVTTTADLTYYRQVSEKGTVQASLYATHYSASTTGPNGLNLRQTYLSGVVGYDRNVGHRLFAGVNVGGRKVFQTGPDPKMDFNANIYLRYRIGDLK